MQNQNLAYRFEYADGSAFEIDFDGRAFTVTKSGRREEKRGKITNNIPRIYRHSVKPEGVTHSMEPYEGPNPYGRPTGEN